ncbi:hypothetical protein [Rhizobium laguerreae]|uniref:hypothetical protein n=1 Tax=Rhizobium laguerreae TaxID=1076926 RepID=UPI0021B0C53C|nr:hypothetical protein [Rhizobium laguerreae]
MSFRKAPWRLIAGLATALIATPTLAIDSTKLQSIRSSLSLEEIVAFAVSKSTAPILDIDNPIDVNIIINVKDMERSDIQALQLEFFRVFFWADGLRRRSSQFQRQPVDRLLSWSAICPFR